MQYEEMKARIVELQGYIGDGKGQVENINGRLENWLEVEKTEEGFIARTPEAGFVWAIDLVGEENKTVLFEYRTEIELIERRQVAIFKGEEEQICFGISAIEDLWIEV